MTITRAVAAACLLLSACFSPGEPAAPPAGSPAAAPAAVASRPTGTCPPHQYRDDLAAVHGQAAARSGMVVEADDFFFAPTCLSAPPGTTLVLLVRNRGQLLHNLALPDGTVDVDVRPGETATVRLTAGSAPLRFVCKYHTSSGMVGFVLPVEADRT